MKNSLMSFDSPVQRKASCSCGGDCPSCQAKTAHLPISQPNDASEIEADRMADKVMRTATAEPVESFVRQTSRRQIQTKGKTSNDSGATRNSSFGKSANGLTNFGYPALPPPFEVLQNKGEPLTEPLREFFEPRLGVDLSATRIHKGKETDSMASEIDARAFTIGNHIVFSTDSWNPSSEEGKRLIAHELAHVVQQSKGLSRFVIHRQKSGKSRKKGASFRFRVFVSAPLDSNQLLIEFVKQYYNLPTSAEAEKKLIERGWRWTGKPQTATAADAERGFVSILVTDNSLAPPEQKSGEEKKAESKYFKDLPPESQSELNAETDRRFREKTHFREGELISDSKDDRVNAEYWKAIRGELIEQRRELDNLPARIKKFLFNENAPKVLEPKDYAVALRIAAKLGGLSETELEDYKSKVNADTNDWRVFEKSIERYTVLSAGRKLSAQRREEIKIKLIGLERVYQLYKDYLAAKSIAAINPPGNNPEAEEAHEYNIERADEKEAELVSALKGHNFQTIEEFETYIDKYKAAFRDETVAIAFDILARYEHILFEEEKKYKDKANAAALYQSVSQTGAKGHYKEADEAQSAATGIIGDPKLTPQERQLKTRLQQEAKATRSQAEAEVSSVGGEHPLVKEGNFDREALAKASPDEVQGMMLEYIADQRQSIEKMRADLIEDPEMVYRLDELMKVSYELQEIEPDKIFDLIIRDHREDISFTEKIKKIALAIAAIIVGLFTFGGGTVAMLAAFTAFGISAYQAVEEYSEYLKAQRAYDVGLSSDDPSVAWVIVAVVGAVVDLGGAASALKAMTPAINAFNGLGDAAKAGNVVELEKELKALATIDEKLRNNIIRAAKAELEYRQAVKGLLATAGRLNMTLVPGAEEFARLVGVAYHLGKRGVIAFEKFILELQLQKIIGKFEDLTPEQMEFLKKAFTEGLEKSKTGLLKYGELSEKIRGVYTIEQVEEVAAQGKAFGLSDKEIEDFLEMGSISKPHKVPPKTPLTVDQIKEQMDEWINVVKPRGYPHLFDDAAAFESFKTKLKDILTRYDVPKGKMYVQGSSLRTTKAKDVDVAIFLPDDEFARYAQKCRDGIIARNAAKPHVQKRLLDQLEEQVKDGYISKFLIDRPAAAPTAAFGTEVRTIIEDVFKIQTDISVMKSSSKLALYPALEL